MALRATLEPLAKLKRLPRNPKAHDLGEIHTSISRFGFLERIIVNDITGRLIAGHGRIDALQQKKAAGQGPPENIEARDGQWLVPADHVSIPESEEEAAAIALNRLGEAGGWDDALLAQVLGDLAAENERALDGLGFDTDDLDELLAGLTPQEPTNTIGRGGRLYEGHDVEPYKLAYRVEAAWRARGKLALDLFSGAGQLAEWYRRRFDKVVTIDNDAKHDTDFVMSADMFITEQINNFMDFDFVDFDDEGSPAREIRSFFSHISGKKDNDFVLALTDGNGLNLKFRGRYNPVMYLQGEDRVRQATAADYEGFEDTVTRFVKIAASEAGFVSIPLSSYRGREGNVVYQTWLIEA